ncbi:MAG: MBL fold metallo-hydrolase, partial [Betaproteobacteria bacterium]|nr:MBL fold metallo-hydrolase [Betaproteobacteria bacterium]
AFGSGGRFQTCILVEADEHRFLVDCGASSLVAMKKRGVSPSTVEAILVTHLHGEHFGGIPFFLLDAQFSRRASPLAIAGPPGLEARTRAAMEVLFPKSSETPPRFPLRFVELAPEAAAQVGPLRVTPYPAVHFCGAPAYALRVEYDGRIIAYSGDTQWTEGLVEASAGADLFICEAYFFDKKVKFHLDYQTLAAHRQSLTSRRLVLTHMSDDMLARAAEAGIETACDGLVVEL